MSNTLAIAAVGATLRKVLGEALGVNVTLAHPDRARGSSTEQQLNLFLYQMVQPSSWRNRHDPRQLRSGETAPPPLALTLRYLLSAWPTSEIDDTDAHAVLGAALRFLHDHAFLDRAAIQEALTGNDLYAQPEAIKVVLAQLPLEDLNRIWSLCQTPYRISAALEVSLVLIDSAAPARIPLPVLTVGAGGSGVAVQPSLTPPLPTLTGVTPPNAQPAARVGEMLTLTGFNLESTKQVNLYHPLLSGCITNRLQEDSGLSSEGFSVQIQSGSKKLYAAGLYTLRAADGSGVETNALALLLCPRVDNLTTVIGSPDTTVTLTVTPSVYPEQRVSLILGDVELRADPVTAYTSTVTFRFPTGSIASGTYIARLRVDGVESLYIDYTTDPPTFAAGAKKVTL